VAFDTIETPEARKEKLVGGSCTYCALAASFFTRPKIVAVVGEDFPEEAIELFRKRDIDLQGLKVSSGKTFHWEGRYGDDPNQRSTVKLEMNVFENFRPELPSAYKDTDILFLANIDPELQEDILRQVKNKKIVAMDTIDTWIKNKKPAFLRVLRKVDMFFANEEEARLLTEEINLIKAGKKILSMGPSFVILKKGEHGALAFGKDFVFGILPYPCEGVVDPTGAGDSFAGGFLGYLDKVNRVDMKEIRNAGVFGSVMASFALEDFGIHRLASLSESIIQRRILDYKKFTSF